MVKKKSPFHGNAVNMHDYKCEVVFKDGSSVIGTQIGKTIEDAKKRTKTAYGKSIVRSVKCKRMPY